MKIEKVSKMTTNTEELELELSEEELRALLDASALVLHASTVADFKLSEDVLIDLELSKLKIMQFLEEGEH